MFITIVYAINGCTYTQNTEIIGALKQCESQGKFLDLKEAKRSLYTTSNPSITITP